MIARKSPVSRLSARYTLPELPRPSSSPSCCASSGAARAAHQVGAEAEARQGWVVKGRAWRAGGSPLRTYFEVISRVRCCLGRARRRVSELGCSPTLRSPLDTWPQEPESAPPVGAPESARVSRGDSRGGGSAPAGAHAAGAAAKGSTMLSRTVTFVPFASLPTQSPMLRRKVRRCTMYWRAGDGADPGLRPESG